MDDSQQAARLFPRFPITDSCYAILHDRARNPFPNAHVQFTFPRHLHLVAMSQLEELVLWVLEEVGVAVSAAAAFTRIVPCRWCTEKGFGPAAITHANTPILMHCQQEHKV